MRGELTRSSFVSTRTCGSLEIGTHISVVYPCNAIITLPRERHHHTVHLQPIQTGCIYSRAMHYYLHIAICRLVVWRRYIGAGGVSMYVSGTTISAYAEWERCCCVNYTLNLLPIASDNQPAKCSTEAGMAYRSEAVYTETSPAV